MNAAEYRRQISQDDAWKLFRNPSRNAMAGIGFPERTIHQVPGPPSGNRNRKRRNEAPDGDVIFQGRNPMATPTPSSVA
jgi:hypothetical protein